MSRLAKKLVPIGKATVSLDGTIVTVKGAKATLTKRIHPTISLAVEEGGVRVTPKDNSRLAKALTGTFASHIKNMAAGVETPYLKKLILEGVGYRVELKGNNLIFMVGFSHPVALTLPDEVTATVEKNAITLSSPNKETIGQFAANIRSVKPPEPYLGKGIRYEGEVIRRKQGKKAV